MVKQYPDILMIEGIPANSTRNELGDWQLPDGDPPSTRTISCRVETRSSVGYVKTTDGKMTEFQSIVYMPLPVDEILVDASVTLQRSGSPDLKATVKHFSRGQLNARVWL